MSKRRMIVYVAIFNVLMIVAFIFSNIYMWNSLRTIVDNGAGYQGQDSYVIPFVEDSGLQVSISHVFFAENATVVNLGPLPTVVPNYPFYVFWISIVGNLALIALVLRKPDK